MPLKCWTRFIKCILVTFIAFLFYEAITIYQFSRVEDSRNKIIRQASISESVRIKINPGGTKSEDDRNKTIDGDVHTKSGHLMLTALGSDKTEVDCLPSLVGRVNRCVRIINQRVLWKTSHEFACVALKIAQNTPICIYDPDDDKYVSKRLYKLGIWEKQMVNDFGEALKIHGVTDVLDVGSNIGVYTLKATKLRKRVVAIDANIENLKLLSKSLVLGNITKNVTLIWNAVSDEYTNVTLMDYPQCIACAHIQNGGPTVNSSSVETMLINDIEHIFMDKIVAIKMDVELSELLALRGAETFLKHIKVKFIQMEIEHHKKLESGQHIVELLKLHGFSPFRTCLGVDNLTIFPVQNWPGNVCFIR